MNMCEAILIAKTCIVLLANCRCRTIYVCSPLCLCGAILYSYTVQSYALLLWIVVQQKLPMFCGRITCGHAVRQALTSRVDLLEKSLETECTSRQQALKDLAHPGTRFDW